MTSDDVFANGIAPVILILICILVLLVTYSLFNSYLLEKRIAKYSVKSKYDKDLSFLNKIAMSFNNVVNKVFNIIGKIKFISKYANSYKKYFNTYEKNDIDYMDIVTYRIILTIILLIINTLIVLYDYISPYSLIFTCVISFFLPDLVIVFRNMLIKKQMLNQYNLFIKLVINNSNNSNLEILNSIIDKIDEPLKSDILIFITDLTYGISLYKCFERLFERTKILKIKETILLINNENSNEIKKVFL